MIVKRVIYLSLLLGLTLSLVNAQTDKKLLGAWKSKTEYETYTLNFISESELTFNGDTYTYSISDGNIVVDYENHPYLFEDNALFITIEGYEYKFVKAGEEKKEAHAAEALLGKWEAKSDYGMNKLTFHSASQLEYDGESAPYTLNENAIVVDYEKYLYRLEGKALMIKWPGEAEYRKFTRVAEN